MDSYSWGIPGSRKSFRFQVSGSEPGTWNLEPGTWNLEPGTWNLEPGTWNLELFLRKEKVNQIKKLRNSER